MLTLRARTYARASLAASTPLAPSRVGTSRLGERAVAWEVVRDKDNSVVSGRDAARARVVAHASRTGGRSGASVGEIPRPLRSGIAPAKQVALRLPPVFACVALEPTCGAVYDRSCAARIWLRSSVPIRRPFGSWSSRSQRQVATIASIKIRHSHSRSRSAPG